MASTSAVGVARGEAGRGVGGQLSGAVFRGGVAVAIVATVLSLGMTFPVAQLLAPVRRIRLLAAMLVLNTVVLPAAAWAVARTVPITDGYVAGIALAAIGSGGAAGLKAASSPAGRICRWPSGWSSSCRWPTSSRSRSGLPSW
jgi:hypothetical protein